MGVEPKAFRPFSTRYQCWQELDVSTDVEPLFVDTTPSNLL
jgi:hypothetical protein